MERDGIMDTALIVKLALAVPFLLGTALFAIKHRRTQARAERALREQLEPYGISVSASKQGLVLSGHWDACAIALRPRNKTFQTKGKWQTTKLSSIEVAGPAQRGSVLAWRGEQQPFFPKAGLTEVALEGPMAGSWRVLTDSPSDVVRWLSPSAQQFVLAVPEVEEVFLRPEGSSLLVARDPSSAPWLLHAIDLAVGLHRGRAPGVPRGEFTQGFGEAWRVGIFVPPFVGLLLGFLITMTPFGRGPTEQVACAYDERLEVVSVRRGDGRGTVSNLHCVGPRGQGPALFVLPMLVTGTPIYLLLALVCWGVAARRRPVPTLAPPDTMP